MAEPFRTRASMSSRPANPHRRRHLLWGWSALLVFLVIGIGLESLHGLKVDAYVGVEAETRRTMWRLAHAHGALLALVHVAFAVSCEELDARMRRHASWSLCLAIVLMPLGFALGGLWFHAGDPGLGVLLVPAGGLALAFGVLTTLRGLHASGGDSVV